MEIVTLKISKDLLQMLFDSEALKVGDIEVKSTDIQDDFFKDDPVHKRYKDESVKAYKNLKNYEYDKRFNHIKK